MLSLCHPFFVVGSPKRYVTTVQILIFSLKLNFNIKNKLKQLRKIFQYEISRGLLILMGHSKSCKKFRIIARNRNIQIINMYDKSKLYFIQNKSKIASEIWNNIFKMLLSIMCAIKNYFLAIYVLHTLYTFKMDFKIFKFV